MFQIKNILTNYILKSIIDLLYLKNPTIFMILVISRVAVNNINFKIWTCEQHYYNLLTSHFCTYFLQITYKTLDYINSHILLLVF